MMNNKRILIVDDQEGLREQLGKLLIDNGQPNKTTTLVQSMRARLMGLDPEKEDEAVKFAPQYDIDTAGQGEEAFEMVKAAIENNAPYALMFSDMRMPPGWDGLKTAKKIREIDKNIEIVIMTAYADHTQNEISDEVGMPEKLLYIKKPFESEEIFQLALSLTAKWSAEHLERMRRGWLEKALVCMRKARAYGNDNKNPYTATLSSFLSFMNSKKGIVAEWDKEEEKWQIRDNQNIDEAFAKNFFEKNSKQLLESNVIQSNVDGIYVIPLKCNDFSVTIGVCDAENQTDPEWYKLLNMLLMTSVDGLEYATIKAQKNYESTQSRSFFNIVKEIHSDAEKLKKKYGSDENIKLLMSKLESALKTVKKDI